MTPRSPHPRNSKPSRGFSLPEVMMVLAVVLAMGLGVYKLFFSGSQASDADTVALGIDNLRADLTTQFSSQPGYSALQTQNDLTTALTNGLPSTLLKGTNGAPGTTWGSLTWSSIPRPCHIATPTDGCTVQNGGYQLALAGVPTDACSKIATHYLAGQSSQAQESTWIDGKQQTTTTATLSACAAAGGHTVTWQHYEYTKPGG